MSKSNNYQGLKLFPRGLGLLLSLAMIRLWPDLDLLYSRLLIPSELLPQYSEKWIIILLDWGSPRLYAGLYIASGLLLAVLRQNFVPAILLFVLHYLFFVGYTPWSYGADYIGQTALFFSLSICSWRSSHYLQFFSRLQLTAIYFFAGLGKAVGPTWWNGEAVWKAIQQPLTPPLFKVPLSAHRYEYLWIGLGILTIIIELGYPLTWTKRFGLFFTNCIILMHIGIALTMGLIHFSSLMIWYNLCAWDHPLLHRIAKPLIQPLETTEPTLQVRTATADLDTRKGGNNNHVK
ncbi:hypothetical protein [Sphingobacterium sp.]|uniref:hypothetical protein n=1 Tax=Sphingobacterium sp. TaxID=341027 RepID=UPI00289D35BC|nr:hypothetical protein [Sphingobacterium sp.]